MRNELKLVVAISLVFAFLACNALNVGAQTNSPASISLLPATAVNLVFTQHTVTATVLDASNNPVAGVTVVFSTVLPGPNSGLTGTAVTSATGQASFTYSDTNGGVGTDTIIASVLGTNITATASKTWVLANVVPEVPYGPIGASLAMMFGVVSFVGLPRIRKRLQ